MNQPEREVVYAFPKGLPGFENYQKFQFIHIAGAPLAKLIALEDEKIGFIIMRAETILADYSQQVILDPETTLLLNGRLAEQRLDGDSSPAGQDPVIEVWVILTLSHQDAQKTTANLRAPLLLNSQNNTGLQVILNDERLLIRQPLSAASAVPALGRARAAAESSNALEKGAAG